MAGKEKKKEFRCKNCSYIFSEPALFLEKGEKLLLCPFCNSREIEPS